MSPDQIFVSNLVAITLVLALGGMLVRGRLRAAPAFALYLAFALLTNRLVTWWPDTFFVRSFWRWRVATSSALEVLVVVELTAVAFRRWRHARWLVHAGILLAMLVGLGGAAAAVLKGPRDTEMLSWAETGATWSFVALFAVAKWYRLPLHPFHRSVCLGFALYLGLFSAVLDLVAHDPYHRLIAALEPAAFAATVGLWALAAWRREEIPEPDREVLYPWTVRS